MLAVAVNLVVAFTLTTAYAAPVHLRCGSRERPLGIDAAAPRLSWQSDNSERNWKQAAYQILVASGPDKLKAGNADVWDSGKRTSADSIGVAYAGPALQSRKRYYWTVKVWDAAGQESQSSEEAWWDTGLLHKSDWSAKWIAWKNPEAAADRDGIRWIWTPGQDALNVKPKAVVSFRRQVELRDQPKDAALYLLSRGGFKAEINGKVVAAKARWHEFDRQDVTSQLVAGSNTIVVTITTAEPDAFGPDAGSKTVKGALAGLLKVTGADGKVLRVPTDAQWQSQPEESSTWSQAAVVAKVDDKRLDGAPELPQPAALMRRTFDAPRTVASARLYVTAMGGYRMFLNGHAVGEDVLNPGYTDYSKRVQYQTYDVTSMLVSGKNAIAAILGDGWFGSGMTWTGTPFFFAPPPTRLLAQLDITYQDGTHATIATDNSWKVAQSPIMRSEIYAGETYDARREIDGWNEASFDDHSWTRALPAAAPAAQVVSQVDQPVRVIQTLAPKTVTPIGGAYVFDLGQNMVGWARLKVQGPAGTRVRLRFAERLNPDGSIYTENLRNADATDTYVLNGKGEETFAPTFTFHGFRYVEVTGYPGEPPASAITGEVVSSLSGEAVARVNTASELVNHMWSIGIWGQRGNFVSIPTDCPQRDERLGWMGDAGVFWRTGSYNFDIEAFTHKFMHDVTDGQTPEGNFTNVAPDALRPHGSEGAPGWDDAGVIVPWTAWMQYGDRSIIEQNWDAMQRFLDFIQKANPDFIRKNKVGPNYADWLAPDENTNKNLLATAYWALVGRMMSQMAHAIGKDSDARRYDELVANIRSAFQKAYVKDDGQVGTGTQTSYVVALYMKLAPEALEPIMVENLVKDIEKRNGHLSTGFLGTPFLLSTLADHGRSDVAYRLLLNDTYPSWGYMLSKGATTWWERWNGDTGDPAMNSYNHYAFGSVVAWVYRYVAGIDAVPDAPGFREILIHPRPGPNMPYASGEYESVYGKISTQWSGSASGPFSLKITIPANTSARVLLPRFPNAQVLLDGNPVKAEEVEGALEVKVGSGSYGFEVK
jgi:alpha-L-rhamnosidase